MRDSISHGLQMHSVQCLSLLPKCFFSATTLEDLLSCTVPQTQPTLNHTMEFYVHVTVHRHKFLFNKTKRRTNFPNLFLSSNSTCFGQFLCPSSGVFHCTFGTCMCHASLMTYRSAECTVENS